LETFEKEIMRAADDSRPDAGDGRTRPGLRIPVVKLSSLGDVAHAVPSVAALALLHPGAEIDWHVEPLAAPFVAELPWVSETVVLDLPAAPARGIVHRPESRRFVNLAGSLPLLDRLALVAAANAG
jgi:hypothetical protein